MSALRMGLACGNLCREDISDEDLSRDALIAIAQVPTVTAAYWRC